MMMTIHIKYEELPEFRELIKNCEVRHGPFRRDWRGYTIDILQPGPMETYFKLKYGGLDN